MAVLMVTDFGWCDRKFRNLPDAMCFWYHFVVTRNDSFCALFITVKSR